MKLLILILGMSCALASAQTHEQKVIAAVLMGEGWNQGTNGMRAIAEVIHQRSVERRKTPLQVVTQRKAFSCLNSTTPAALISKFEHQPFYRDQALPLAMEMARWRSDHSGITQRSTHYSRKTERPWWAHGQRPQVVIGKHAFYRLAKY